MNVEEKDIDGNVNKSSSSNVEYYLSPNYFYLVKILEKMKNDLVLEDKGSVYKLSLRSQNVDLYGLFKDQYSLDFNNFSQSDTTKKFEVEIDKESNLLTKLMLNFNLESEQLGNADLTAVSEFYDFSFDDDQLGIKEF